VLQALPTAGVRVTTLRGAAEAGLVGAPVELPASSWGSGKDWRVWAGEQVADLVALNERVQKALLGAVTPGIARDPLRDALAQEALLALSSDWAFMVSKDSAAGYARERAHGHAARVEELVALLAEGRDATARRRTATWPPVPFGHIDARLLRRPTLPRVGE
jgi:1,4-alpha-glucan branching enzyme